MKKLLKTKGTAILLSVCAATALCVNLANSCSGDEDYDKYRGDELQTHAAATRSVSEEQGTVIFAGKTVQGGSKQTRKTTVNDGFAADLLISWTRGWTGNINQPHSNVTVDLSAYKEGEAVNIKETYNNTNRFLKYDKCYVQSSSGEWVYLNKIKVTLNYECQHHTETYRLYDYNYRTCIEHTVEIEKKNFTKEFTYNELGCKEDTTLVSTN